MKQIRRFSGLGWLPLLVLLALSVAGCRSQGPAVTPTAPSAATDAPQALPAIEAVALVEPESGGLVRLRSGAEVSIPPQALSAKAAVTLRTLGSSPAAPVPRSSLGQIYEFALEDGELTGVALLRLPLPAGVTPDQYDVAPYRWNGSAWERINSRLTGDMLQFGVNAPGIFGLQGTWRLADATLTLIKPDTPAVQMLTPLAVAGQYRFSALPLMTGEYVQARLTLKQDVSGGAGRVTGNPALDATVTEAALWFRPDPTRAQGLIDFSHVFEFAPGDLDVAPGSTTRLYALLEVDDASAATRRLSTGIEYTQILPIQIVGMEVARPELASEGQYGLRWHVQLNGQTFQFIEALGTRLPLEAFLAQGGLGDYRITLEADTTGAWAPVSNEVTVQLALRPTEGPTPSLEATPEGLVAITSPTPAPEDGSPPAVGQPATPTRRPTPIGGPAPTSTPTPETVAIGPGATPTPTRPAWASVFWADRYNLTPGECTTLHWQVENVIEVFLDGQGVSGRDTRQVCPSQTTSYTLRVRSTAGIREFTIPITVTAQGQAAIEFTADSYRVAPSQCTVLRWRVTNVRAVYLNNQGVSGEASQQVCPTVTTDYTLRVESADGTVTNRTITIVIAAGPVVDMRFWADQYTLAPNVCTTLHWIVRNVREVFLNDEGVAGDGARQICPTEEQINTLRAITNDGQEAYQFISLASGYPNLAAGEIIAQGIVNDVTRQDDLDPITPGAQPGYSLVVDGINLLFAGTGGWSQAAANLRLPQQFLDSWTDDLVSWPINPGQLVEFRANCEGSTCTLQVNSYLYLRSP